MYDVYLSCPPIHGNSNCSILPSPQPHTLQILNICDPPHKKWWSESPVMLWTQTAFQVPSKMGHSFMTHSTNCPDGGHWRSKGRWDCAFSELQELEQGWPYLHPLAQILFVLQILPDTDKATIYVKIYKHTNIHTHIQPCPSDTFKK